MKMIALVSQLALAMLTALFISGGIGYAIDAYYDTNFFIFFLIVGVGGGYRSCYRIICKFLGKRSLFEKPKKDMENGGKIEK